MSWKRSALVIINPFSGSKIARNHFEKVEASFKAFGFELDVIETKHKNHSKEIIENYDKDKLAKVYIIIFFSGDGTIHEALQGFYSRSDCNELYFRISCFPGGGATAAAGNQCFHHGLDRISEAINS